MRAFLEVCRFEIRYQLRSPLFLSIAGFFFLMTFMAMASESVQIGGGTAALNLNAPYVILQTQLVFSFIGMFAAVAFVATAITRDIEAKTAELFFASGVSERAFVLGRFVGGSLFAVLAGVAALLGTLSGTLMPWLDQERLSAFSLAPYGFALAWIIVPNYLLSCALFYTAAALTRSIAAAYVAALVFMVAYVISGYFVEPDQLQTAALLDPLGMTAFAETTRYWTVFERNTLLPEGSLFLNRAIWMGVTALFVAFVAWRFEFRLSAFRFRSRKKARHIEPPTVAGFSFAEPVLDGLQPLRQMISQLKMDVRGVVRSPAFYVILALGVFNVLGGFEGSINGRFGTPVYPVTAMMLNVIGGSFMFIVLIIIMYYSGELVHRERQYGLFEIVDSTPYPNAIMVIAKVGALWFVITMLLLTVMLTSMVMQLVNGYTNIEPLLYLKGLFGALGFDFYLIAVLAVFIQVLLPNKWFGLFGLVVVFISMQTLPSLGFEHNLYLFGMPYAPYSDMNGYGHYVLPMLWFGFYWAIFSLLLMLLAHLFFRRGATSGVRERMHAARLRFTPFLRMSAFAAVVGCAVVGGYIYYNTTVLNEFLTEDDIEQLSADYEKKFAHIESQPQPQLVDVDVSIDLYPASRRLDSKGKARVVNQTAASIPGFTLTVDPRLSIHDLTVDGAQLIDTDAKFGHYPVQFSEPLAPGEERHIRWSLSWLNPGFRNSNFNDRVVENGTFVNNTEVMPVTGYDSSRELQDNNVRRQYDLPPVERLPALGDERYLALNQMGVSARTGFRAVMSTAADQIAIAPGYLVNERREGDRRYFEYEMDAPIWPFFSFLSARYAVVRDRWKDVALEVYYHPEHEYNVQRMIEASKQSLEYFTEAFSSYQYRQFRILEFPGYASFAQSFPNTIPYSESIGFVADLRDPKDIDYVFYVTAHELAHQWWAHQVIGARMQGMTMIVETLAQYSALMVMEKAYGRNKMRRFLKHELDAYLRARGGELIEELPLSKVENQGYIHYRKGSVVLYALKEAIGEDAVNAALRSFIQAHAFREAPYPTSQDLIDEFRRVAEEDQQALITDLFERITVHDIRVTDARTRSVGDQFETVVTVQAHKYYADGGGAETETSMAREVTIGLYPEGDDTLGDDDLPEPLVVEAQKLVSGENQLVIVSKSAPHRVVVDPGVTLIDRNPSDNSRQVSGI